MSQAWLGDESILISPQGGISVASLGKGHLVGQQTQAEPAMHWLVLGTAGTWPFPGPRSQTIGRQDRRRSQSSWCHGGSFPGASGTQTFTELRGMSMSSLGLGRREGCSRGKSKHRGPKVCVKLVGVRVPKWVGVHEWQLKPCDSSYRGWRATEGCAQGGA